MYEGNFLQNVLPSLFLPVRCSFSLSALPPSGYILQAPSTGHSPVLLLDVKILCLPVKPYHIDVADLSVDKWLSVKDFIMIYRPPSHRCRSSSRAVTPSSSLIPELRIPHSCIRQGYDRRSTYHSSRDTHPCQRFFFVQALRSCDPFFLPSTHEKSGARFLLYALLNVPQFLLSVLRSYLQHLTIPKLSSPHTVSPANINITKNRQPDRPPKCTILF